MTARIIRMVNDSTQRYSFDPESCAHHYEYNADGTKASDAAFERATGRYFMKSFAYADGNLTDESDWVLQTSVAT